MNLERAIALAVAAHHGQVDKAGAPYILHPLRLMLRMHTEQAMIAAVLHDVVEDSDWTLAMLQEEGFSQVVLDAVDSLTRREDESYEAYIARLAPNPLARMVKIVDLEDNMDLRRYRHIGDKELARLQRYMQVWQSLQAMQ